MDPEIEEEVKSLADYWQIILRRKSLIVIPMLVLMVISMLVALFLPPIYRSEATVLIEQQQIPSDLVQSTVVSLADERIKQIEQKIMTVNNINNIIKKYKLYQGGIAKLSYTELAAEFMENYELNLVSANVVNHGRSKAVTLAFKVSFSHKDPVVAQKITNELITFFLDENIKNRTARAMETTTFFDEEAEKFRLQIQESENKIAEFKEKNSESLPELLAVNVASISRTENLLQQLTLQEKMLNERQISLRSQLTATSQTTIIPGTTDTQVPETLETLEAEYKRLVSRYSELHPDVKSIKRKMDGWNKSSGSGKSSAARGITNPVYLQLKSELDIAAFELKNIHEEKQKLYKTLEKLERRVSKTHQVERGGQDLMRDLDNQRAKYQELKSKAIAAKLAQTLEEEQKAEKFSLLEPALVPTEPEKPNRLKILLFGFLLSIGVGLATGYMAEVLDSSIRGHRALERVTGVEPLVVIPYIEDQSDIDRARKNKRNFIIIIISVFVAIIAIIHFLYRPLDLLWYQALHRISML